MVAASLDRFVRQRANDRCEYCLMPQMHHVQQFHIDHILARQHSGDESLENLALACFRCNGFKGTNIAGIDPSTRTLIPLFNPRFHRWPDHFAWNGPTIVGITPIGRVTVYVLNMNEWSSVRLRAALMARNLFFPIHP